MSFLQNLPTESKGQNFSKLSKSFKITKKRNQSKPIVYTCTHETTPPSAQVITTENTNILLRYLYQQVEIKNAKRKRLAEDNTDKPAK
mmetsp:Transcript_10643/g.14578  ORF Transcript_10643/g.14578 Transcript_10643/m.14578 type:complete len:88 (-) Transcript_10643:57-320(-)